MSFWVLQGIACTRLTYEIYKRCKGFLKYFRNTSQVIWSLRIELEKLTEICCGAAFRQTIYRDGRLEVVVSRMSVQDILMSMQDILGRELNNLVKKFMSTWDRSGWGSKDISHLVSRLFITTIKRELHRAFPLWSRDHDGSRMTAQGLKNYGSEAIHSVGLSEYSNRPKLYISIQSEDQTRPSRSCQWLQSLSYCRLWCGSKCRYCCVCQTKIARD